MDYLAELILYGGPVLQGRLFILMWREGKVGKVK